MGTIVEGCLAIVIKGHPKDIGKCVRVGKFIGKHRPISYVDLWEVDRDISYRSRHRIPLERTFRLKSGKRLMRIDDPNGFKVKTKSKELVKC